MAAQLERRVYTHVALIPRQWCILTRSLPLQVHKGANCLMVNPRLKLDAADSFSREWEKPICKYVYLALGARDFRIYKSTPHTHELQTHGANLPHNIMV